jgi:glutaredoxin-related protein
MNYYRLFVKSNCSFCERAVKHISAKNETFVAMQIKEEKLNKIKNNYDWPTVPLIIKVNNSEETFIGGYSELTEEESESTIQERG